MRTLVAGSLALLLAALVAGCSGPGGEADDAASPDGLPGDGGAAPSPSVDTTDYGASWELGYAAGPEDNTALGSNWPEHEAKGNVTGVVVEMEWTPATPTADRLSLRVEHGDVVKASGTSPVRLVFEGAAAKGGYRMSAVAAEEPGAYVHQAVTFHVTVFTDAPFDPSYSAVGAAGDAAP